ncbi:MAG TPA: SCO family protein [Polyangia bacterium]
MKHALAAALLFAVVPTPARAIEKLPDNVGVVEKLGERVPTNLVFNDENGKRVQLGDYLKDGKPVLIALVYFKCEMLCSLTLNGIVGALRQQTWKLGKEYRVITVSFDPNEKPELALAKQRGYLGALGLLPEEHGHDWPFLTGDKQNLDALADALGFKFRWDAVNKTWDHTAAIMALSPDGKITRYLYGVQYPSNDVRMALFEAGDGKVGTTFERVLLRCYAYDTSTKSYRVFAITFMRIGALTVLGMLVILLTLLWRRDLRRSRAEAHQP